MKWDRYSSFDRVVNVFQRVRKFINNIKTRLREKDSEKYSHFVEYTNDNLSTVNMLIRTDQSEQFPDILDFFSKSNIPGKNIPNLVQQLNIFIDSQGILRVGSKIAKRLKNKNKFCPILLSKNSLLTVLIIRKFHDKLFHSGIYAILSEFRQEFYVSSCFSVIKKVLKSCVHCKRFNGRTIKNNQSSYRDFRLTPDNRPFSAVAIDYAGPFKVKINSKLEKVYVLVITCLFTRAINLKVSLNLTTREFIRSFQLHTFEYGLSRFVLSDSGSQIVAGADIITNFLSDPETVTYLKECGSELIEFQQYFKGRHELGSLVEICVKLCKRLLSGAIKNYVLEMREFEFIVANATHLVNRRPVAFKDSLRDNGLVAPKAISPEQLIHGFALPSVNIIPSIQAISFHDLEGDRNYDPVEKIKTVDDKLRNVRTKLIEAYNVEFLPQLIAQATNDKSRYKPVSHDPIQVGDIVLLKEEHTKQCNYPMARVKRITLNELGEVTGAVLLKGSTGETVRRHSSVIIPLLQDTMHADPPDFPVNVHVAQDSANKRDRRTQRTAAAASERLSKAMLAE